MATVYDTAFYPGLDKITSIGGGWAVYLGGASFAGSGWIPSEVELLKQHVTTVPVYVPLQNGLNAQRANSDAVEIINALKQFSYESGAVFVDLENGTILYDLQGAADYISTLGPILRAAGYKFGLYSSQEAILAVQNKLANSPDAVWVGSFFYTDPQPQLATNQLPNFPPNLYDQYGQRAWQYAGLMNGTPAIVQGVNVDISVFDDTLLTPVTELQPPTPPVVAPEPAPAPSPAQPAPAPPETYVIESGDTLWGIEDKFSLPHGYLYQINQQTLDNNAQARGFRSSEQGRLIWPGETIKL